MSFVVEFSPAARRQLKKLDSPIQKRIFRRIERLEKQPRPKSAKKLLGPKEPLYRVRHRRVPHFALTHCCFLKSAE